MKKKIVILVFLIILISSVSIVSAADIKPAKETQLKDNGIRYTLPSSVTKPTNIDEWNKNYKIRLGNGKIEPYVRRYYFGWTDSEYDNYLSFSILGISSKKINKVVLHLENQSFENNGNKNLNSFTHTLTPEQEKTKKGYEFTGHDSAFIETNSPKSGGMTITSTMSLT